jgi:nicotinamidase-related amidase
MTRPWDGLYSADELETWRLGGYGSQGGLGERPAVLVIDVVRAFTGDKGDDHAASLAKFRQSCGPYAWKAMPFIQRLIAAGREKGLPIVFTRASAQPPALRVAQMRKNRRAGRESAETLERGKEFPPEIAPHEGDIVVEKPKPSVFFGSPLLGHLLALKVDHVIIAGCTTSGCVRASVYDAFQYEFGVTVVEDAVFDRFPTSHKVNLFDMNAKFADVRPLADVLADLGVPERVEVAAS